MSDALLMVLDRDGLILPEHQLFMTPQAEHLLRREKDISLVEYPVKVGGVVCVDEAEFRKVLSWNQSKIDVAREDLQTG